MLDYAKDEKATSECYATGIMRDKRKRSYVDNLGHLHMRGVDRSFMREYLFLAVKGLCETCGRYRDRQHGDMDHEGKTPRTRCECFHRTLNNGAVCVGIRWRCGMIIPGSCHRKRHNREPRFGEEKAHVHTL